MAFPYRVMAWRPSLEISMLHMDITHSFAATKQLNEKEKVKSWHRKGRTHLPQNQKKSRNRIQNIPWVYHLAQKKQPEHHGKIGYLQYPKSLGCPGAPKKKKKTAVAHRLADHSQVHWGDWGVLHRASKNHLAIWFGDRLNPTPEKRGHLPESWDLCEIWA